jgi:SpoVK/Ycf46/Vps4 family AAA+-type ATPase
MKHISEVIEIIDAGIKNNPQKLVNYAELLAKKLEKENESKSATRIRKTLLKVRSIPMSSKNLSLKDMPVDSESRLPLAEIVTFSNEDVSLVLPEVIKSQIDEYIDVINRADELVAKGIKGHRNLLLSGPPGTGKSQTAKYIASKTNFPLLTVRIDGLISSFLGSTSKNIRQLFDYVDTKPCILFLDEFDAFAKMRDDSHELGELKRVVNTLLQNMDNLKKPIIAATNHEHLLDPAVWRRFEYSIKLDLPSEDMRKDFLDIYLSGEQIYENNKKTIIALTKNMSGSIIENFCEAIKTNIVLSNSKISMNNIYKIYLRTTVGSGELPFDKNKSQEKQDILVAKSLRNKSNIDFRTLSELTGIPKSTLHRALKEVK